jgi:hypothetical protein
VSDGVSVGGVLSVVGIFLCWEYVSFRMALVMAGCVLASWGVPRLRGLAGGFFRFGARGTRK